VIISEISSLKFGLEYLLPNTNAILVTFFEMLKNDIIELLENKTANAIKLNEKKINGIQVKCYK